MFESKKISLFIVAALMAAVIPCRISNASPVDSEKQFMEDFESYSIAEVYDEDNNLKNARPADGDYSDIATYPNGTASVYEGNAANNIAVKDCDGNDVYGGLPGWYGYLNGNDTKYNQYNRRLSVYRYLKYNKDETNQTKFLKMEPKAGTYQPQAMAKIERENVDLDNYSFLSARLNISGNLFNAGVELTMDDSNGEIAAYNLLKFNLAADGSVDVNFAGQKVGTISSLSSFNEDVVADWYTMEYRIYNNGTQARHSLLLVNDVTKNIVADVKWMVMETGNDFKWLKDTQYGIRFYAESDLKHQTRFCVDDIKFVKDSFTEDFSSYNTKYDVGEGRIINAPGGNTNLSVYAENGVYEGNLQKNNSILRTIGTDGNIKYEKVNGNVPFWQGYMGVPHKQPITGRWEMRCNIAKASDYIKDSFFGGNNIIYMAPKTTNTNDTIYQGRAYAGMESADFSDGTQWLTTLVLESGGGVDKGQFKLQLTKGRSIDSANAPQGNYVDYDGISHAAYLDVLTFDLESKKMYFAGSELSGTFVFDNKYDVYYTLDRTGDIPMHSIKIVDAQTNTEVTSSEKIPVSGFDFTGDMIGFRYAALSDENIVGHHVKAFIRKLGFEKFFGSNVTGIDDDVYIDSAVSDESGISYKIVSELNKDVMLIYSNYINGNLNYVKLVPLTLNSGVNEGVISDTSTYGEGKLLVWDNFDSINPMAKPYNVLLMQEQSDFIN